MKQGYDQKAHTFIRRLPRIQYIRIQGFAVGFGPEHEPSPFAEFCRISDISLRTLLLTGQLFRQPLITFLRQCCFRNLLLRVFTVNYLSGTLFDLMP